jgi:hypothetical protein
MKKKRCCHKRKLQIYLDEKGVHEPLDEVWRSHLYGREESDPGCSICRDFYEGYLSFLASEGGVFPSHSLKKGLSPLFAFVAGER